MNIQAAAPRQIERRLRQDQTVGDDNQELGLPACKSSSAFRRLQLERLRDLESAGEGDALDRARLRVLAAACRPVGLRQDADDFMALDQRFEWRNGELRSTRERDSQPRAQGKRASAPSRGCAPRSLRSLSSFLRMRCRFSSER